MPTNRTSTARMPSWIRRRFPTGSEVESTRAVLKSLNLHTVCLSAHCPNMGECFTHATATFLLLGSVCTRSCRFCAITEGDPAGVDPEEPARIAEASHRLGLRHLVVTSVTRDDLPDGGADHFRRTIESARKRNPGMTVEVLTPDFQGRAASVHTVAGARPDVFAHNLETVPRLYDEVRPGADYQRSLAVLRRAKESGCTTKSGIMLGLGEWRQEVLAVLEDLRRAGCDMLTIGQYLRPSKAHAEVKEYLHPSLFDEYEGISYTLGFKYVAAGPFVRSSFHAAEAWSTLHSSADLADIIR